LSLCLELVDPGRARLVIADDGIGGPAPGTRPAGSPGGTGLGLKIIPMLAGQMHAGCEWHTVSGMQLTLTFPVE
jgi:hypothetical protein